MATLPRPTASAIPRSRDDRPAKRKKEQRTEIWSNLLRQTREAQARSRTSAVQHRELLLLGGSPEDQHALVHSLARPPPPGPPSRSREQRRTLQGGDVKLSNRYAYGYGHVTLFSAPQQQGAGIGFGGLGGEAEEVVRLEVHTLPEPEAEYERTLRRLLAEKKVKEEGREVQEDDGFAGGDERVEVGRRPTVGILLSWKEPWRFLSLLRRWLQLLARALLPPDARFEDPLEVLKEHKLALTVVVQHVEAQESLEREGYREESFDYISQCIRTCILPLSAAMVYTSSGPPPQQPGSALTETQKVLYSSLAVDLAALAPAPPKGSSAGRRDDLVPKHNVVDRMALVVPSGWDSAGKIRLLSETFSPESVLEAWIADLNVPLQVPTQPVAEAEATDERDAPSSPQANGGAAHDEEVYATSDAGEEDPDLAARPLSPTKRSLSAIDAYEQAVLNPNAHKAPKAPTIEVTTKPTQEFLAEMRTHLQALEAEDAEKAKNSSERERVATTAGVRPIGLPSGEQTGALSALGDVQFNVGGVSYNAVSAEAAIERLRRPAQLDSPTPSLTSPRNTTPRPPRREDREVSGGMPSMGSKREVSSGTPKTSGKQDDLPIDKLEEYFHSLMKRGGGGSGSSTPSKSSAAH